MVLIVQWNFCDQRQNGKLQTIDLLVGKKAKAFEDNIETIWKDAQYEEVLEYNQILEDAGMVKNNDKLKQ